MVASIAWLVILVIGLLLVAGIFAAADAALTATSVARVEELVRERRTGAKQLLVVVNDRARHTNLLLLLRLTAELSATVVVTAVSIRQLGSTGLALLSAAVFMLLVCYVLIGVGPRTIGRQHPYRTGLYTAWLVRALGLILGPLSRLLILLGNAITPGKGYREGPFSTDVEFREMVDLAQARGVVDDDEREMIHSVFDLGDTIAREIMVPRPEVVWIESTKTIRQAVALSLRTGFTRLPVVGESVDDVLGIVNLKDMIRREMYGERAAKSETVLDVLVPASFIPDSKRLDDLLSEMQAEHTHLAIVVDEYGGTAGIVTIEDVLEEIVGEITDESDTDEQAPIEEITPGTWRVSARVSIEDLAEEVDREIRFDENEVETVAGLMAQRLGKVPLPGTELDVAGLRLVAEGGKDRRGRLRITTVLVSRLAKEEEDEDEDAGD